MEASFPRGKKSKHDDDGSKKRKKSVDSEVLFGKKDKSTDEVVEKENTVKRIKHKSKDDVATKNEMETKPNLATMITFKTLRPQMHVMGVIRQINENDLVISLPNKLNGVVLRKETSDELYNEKTQDETKTLNDLFVVGQYVACIVLKCSKEEKGKRIELSLRLSLINTNVNIKQIIKGTTIYASISSVEDHGVIMNLGVRGFTGFVPSKDLHLPEGITEAQVGQIYFCTVTTVNSHTNIATLTTERATTVKSVTRGDSYTMSSLSLGMLLNVKVEQILANGLQVNFLTFFSGTVESNHMSYPCQKDWTAAYSKGLKGRARIIAIDNINKSVSLSMAPHVVYFQAPEFNESIGDIIEEAVIHRMDAGIGMLLSLAGPSSIGGERLSWKEFRPAYAHISRCVDGRIEKLDKTFKLDQIVRARVMGHCAFDGIVNLTLAPSDISKVVLRQCDLVPGSVIKGKVATVETWGILVDICNGVRGLVSANHAPSVALKKTMSKYKPGHTIECRILKVDIASKKTYLRLKKGLVSSELEPITSYAQATPGTVAHGFITKIAEFGLVVGFYNGVHGLVPAATLHKSGVEDIAAAYTTGQVIKVAVVRCDPAKMRMTLTFDMNITTSKHATSTAIVEAGTVVQGKVVEIEDDFVRVQTTDGLEGILQRLHLTDFPRLLTPSIAVGDEVECLVLMQTSDGMLQLTKKPTLLRQKDSIPSKFADVKEGQNVTGFVREVRPYGVFVCFLNNLQGLAPLAYLTERFVSSPDGIFQVGDTVQCVVDKVSPEKNQFHLDFRVKAPTTDYLEALLLEQTASHAPSSWANHHVGHTEKADFISAKGYGHVCTLSDESTVVVPSTSDLTWSENDSVKLRLIDFDFGKSLFFADASSASFVKAGEKKGRKAASRLSKDAAVEATVLLLRDEYAVVMVNELVALLQVASFHHPDVSCELLGLEVGQTHKCIAKGYLKVAGSPFDELPVVVLENKRVKPSKSSKDGYEHLPKYSGSDLVIGASITARIIGIKDDSMELKIKCSHSVGKVNAYVSIADVDHVKDKNSEHQHPFDAFSTNSIVHGRILTLVEKGSNQRKPVSAENPASFRSINVTLRQADQGKDTLETRPDWTDAGYEVLQSGKFFPGVVVETVEDGLMVRLSSRVVGFLHVLELSTDLSVLESFSTMYPIGTPVSVRSLKCDPEKKSLDLSCHEPRTFEAGDVVIGRVNQKVKALAAPSVMVQLEAHTFGRVCVTEVVDAPTNLPLANLTHGTFVQAVVLTNKPTIEMSVKPSAISNPEEYVANDKTTSSKRPAINDIVSGYVATVSGSGCFVRLHRSITAKVLLRNLSDEFVKEPATLFPPGTLVAGRVIKAEDGMLELSLKASVVTDSPGQLTVESLQVGQTVKGTIGSIQKYGVFVRLEKSTLSGLCHISEVMDGRVNSLEGVFSVGDYVKAKVLKIENRRISLGLKPSYFENDESSDDESDDEDIADDNEDEEEIVDDVDMEAENDDEVDDDEEINDENMGDDDDNDDEEPVSAPQVDFTWDGFSIDPPRKNENDINDDDNENDEDEISKSKLKRMKKKLKEHEDMYVAYRERALAAGDNVPESADDFERLLAVTPQNSFLWIQYIAFHVSQTDISSARDVAIRATSKISFRDIQEKLNVWIAFLNFEHDHGDEITFQRVFNSACRSNDPKKIYLQLIEIYQRHNQHNDILITLKTMQKKFNSSCKIWLCGLKWYMMEQDSISARQLLQRSMKSLPKHKHFKILTKFALMQYEYNEMEHGRTMFEEMISNYPKKMDLWNLYLDREIKYGKQDSTRLLFERVLTLQLSAKKMKSLFKKYLTYEMDHGTDQSVKHVQELAAAYVESSAV